jgi:hypothetical protein
MRGRFGFCERMSRLEHCVVGGFMHADAWIASIRSRRKRNLRVSMHSTKIASIASLTARVHAACVFEPPSHAQPFSSGPSPPINTVQG